MCVLNKFRYAQTHIAEQLVTERLVLSVLRQDTEYYQNILRPAGYSVHLE